MSTNAQRLQIVLMVHMQIIARCSVSTKLSPTKHFQKDIDIMSINTWSTQIILLWIEQLSSQIYYESDRVTLHINWKK